MIKQSMGALSCVLLVCSVPSWAQQISGTINGFVKDAQQGGIADTKIVLTDQAQGSTRETKSAADGSFVITPVQPGSYTMTIESSGFKKFEQRDIKVFANDRVSLGDVILSVGALTETVTVEGQVAQVQTSSAERSGVLTSSQVKDIAAKSRNFLDLVGTLPGIVYTGGLGGIQANGNRGNQNNLTIDGVTNVDTGSNGGTLATTNIDMIAEMKVITNSQQAEFGRSSGAQIEVVTKSGTKEFHGTGYFFHRHEDLNANRWRDNIDGRSRQFYRYNFAGFNVGGPAYIPKVFNRNKDKFFFFAGIEWQNQLVPNGLRNVTVPTALERKGDFSQSHDGGGAPLTILDPANNKAPFPNNIIPQNRLNPDGVKILNFYPQPNALGKDPGFNYQSQVSDAYPRREEIYRGDYNISDKWKAYARFIRSADTTNKNYGQWNADYNIPFSQMNFGAPGWSFVANVTTVINPTLTNEFVFGSSKNVLNIDPVDDTFSRKKLNLSYQMPYPSADKLDLIQNWRFGGVPNGPFTGFNGTPFRNFNHTYDITDTVAKVHGPHTFKAGIYLHKSLKDQTAFTSANGNIYFDRDANNPGDTGWDFSNALLGNFQRLQQSNVILNGQYRSWNVEWFLQDNWRVNSKLTLEYGLRFYWVQPQYDAALQTSSWNPALFDRAAAGVLRIPALDASGKRIAVNPLTGETAPAALAGSIVNTGKGFINGLYANGMGRAGKNYPQGLIDDRGILYAPRIGIAYQIASRTVLRAGGGIFYDRLQGNPVFDMLPNPPSTASPQFYYGNLASIPPASAGIFYPANVNGFDKNGQIPTTYNWNLTVQRELPGNIVADVAYVGSTANHLLYRRNSNAPALGSAWLPQNQDALNPNPKFDGSTTQAVNFYRPFQGYADANVLGFGANSNYNSLQVSAHRRFGKDLTFGGAYTWSKVLGTTTDDGTVNNPFNMRQADYGPLFFDRTHLLVFNYVYHLPKVARGSSGFSKAAGLITNNWEISGFTTMVTGQPDNLSFSINGISNLNERYTGSPNVGPRVVLKNSPSYPKSQYQWLDSSVVGLPVPKGSQGFDSAPRNIRRPGDQNWDISVFKNFPYLGEGRYLQLRAEMFNAWNHPRFDDFNRSATFDQSGRITNLPNALGGNGGRFGFGALTSTRDPRIIQLAAKLYF